MQRSAKNRHSNARAPAETKIRELSGRKSPQKRAIRRRVGNARFAETETIWTKLAAPHAGIEPSLRKSSQERNFLLQRPGGEMGSFAAIAGTETALTGQFGRHAFENAALFRVSHTLYNYSALALGSPGLEPGTR